MGKDPHGPPVPIGKDLTIAPGLRDLPCFCHNPAFHLAALHNPG